MQLITLNEDFYNAHRNDSEILQKKTRPYVCLAVRIGGVLFAIPFRHHIGHKYAFITYGECGLDYTKSIVIEDDRYIDPNAPQVDRKEYNAIKDREALIRSGLMQYINLYKKAVKYRDNPHYRNVIRCSALQYFERYL